MPPRTPSPSFIERVAALTASARGRVHLGASFLYRGDERRRLGELAELAAQVRAPLVATNDVLYHEPGTATSGDVLTCIREKCTIAEAGFRLEANAERHLKAVRRWHGCSRTIRRPSRAPLAIAERARFSLETLRMNIRTSRCRRTRTPQQHLQDLAWLKAAERYPEGVPGKVRALLGQGAVGLIAKLDYARYFLTVYDVRPLRPQPGHPLPGPRSAANSAVCYCLGVTAVDPTKIDLLFERLHLRRTKGSRGHRRRFRARAARRGDPVSLRALRPRSRRHLLDRDPLPPRHGRS